MKRPRPYNRHGHNALKARVKIRGLAVLDLRTTAARSLVAFRDEMQADLGGADALSAQQRAVVEMATRTRLYIESLDAWLMEQPSLVLNRRRAVLPVLRERQQLVDSLARLLGQLGLERRVKLVPDIRALMATRTASSPRERASGPETASGPPEAPPAIQNAFQTAAVASSGASETPEAGGA